MTISTLVDTNILIDMLGSDTPARQWSALALRSAYEAGPLVLSPVVWAELSASPMSEAALLSALSWLGFKRDALPFEAAHRAGKAHRQYRLAGGQRERTLPDFLIGAHADWRRYRLLTRDPARYKTYFPMVEIVSPETHPLPDP